MIEWRPAGLWTLSLTRQRVVASFPSLFPFVFYTYFKFEIHLLKYVVYFAKYLSLIG